MKLGFWRARIPFLSQRSNKMHHLSRLNHFLSLEFGRRWKERQLCCCQCRSKHCCPLPRQAEIPVSILCIFVMCWQLIAVLLSRNKWIPTFLFHFALLRRGLAMWCRLASSPSLLCPSLPGYYCSVCVPYTQSVKGLHGQWKLEQTSLRCWTHAALRLMEDVGRRVIA